MPATVDVQALLQEGLSFHKKGARAEAARLYRQVLAQQPRHYDALHLLGVMALQARNFAEAVELIEKAIAAEPDNPARAEAYINLGTALRSLKRFEEAVARYDQAIAADPCHAAAHSDRAHALYQMGRHEDAVASLEAAITLNPGSAALYRIRGDILNTLKRHEAAVESYDGAIERDAKDAKAHYGRGLALNNLSRHRSALESFDKAVALEARRADFHFERALVLSTLHDYQSALVALDATIALNPGHVGAYAHRGIILLEFSRYQAALESYEKAIALKPNFAEAHQGRGNALTSLKRYQEALESFDQAFTLKPSLPYLQGARLNARMMLCDWRDFGAETAAIRDRLARGEKAVLPFVSLSLIDAPELQRAAAATFTSRFPAASALPRDDARHVPGRKIRIGYFSMDFRDHPVGFLVAPLIETHDRANFEIYGFSYGPSKPDETRTRLERAFDVFVDVAAQSDAAIVEMARERQIDIAVDLAGYTAGCRPGIFARRTAPIQVNYLGYPGSTALPAMDYIIGDGVVVPMGRESHYSERIARLPASYQPNDRKLKISEKTFTRAELGLPETAFVFCCFNNNFKITPDTFDVWMRILRRVTGSVLWLLEDNSTAAANLRAEAERRGVAGDRLVFAKRMPRPDHLARHRAADLFLDTLPYNAHTTASDTLWAGLPMLTCIGSSFASRVAASLLQAVGSPELITTTQEEFETVAVALAADPARLAALRQTLARNRVTAPLFDIAEYTRNLEVLYTRMVDRLWADQPPEDLDTLPATAAS